MQIECFLNVQNLKSNSAAMMVHLGKENNRYNKKETFNILFNDRYTRNILN